MAIFTLDTTDNAITGTSDDDTFNAPTASTLNPGDSLDGGAGNDTLALAGGGTYRVDQLAAFTGFEFITLNPSSGSAFLHLGNQALTVNDNGTFDAVFLGSGATTVFLGSGGSVLSTTSAEWNSTDVIDGSVDQSNSNLFLNDNGATNATYDLTANTLTKIGLVFGSGNNLTLKINSADVASVNQFTSGGSSVLTTSGRYARSVTYVGFWLRGDKHQCLRHDIHGSEP